ncbi:unnamed protein product [Alternaria alternata]
MGVAYDELEERHGFEEETRRALLYYRVAWDRAYMAEYEFDKVVKLDIRLKNIKLMSLDTLKIEIEGAGGLTSYWDRLDLVEQTCFYDEVHAVKSAILAVILRVLGSATGTAEWLQSEINKEDLDRDGSLLFRAVASGVPETVELLLVHGADLLRLDRMAIDKSRGYGMELLVSLHIFLRSLPESVYIEASPSPVHAWGDEADVWTTLITPFRLLENHGVIRLGPENVRASELTWIHIPRNNIIFNILRILTLRETNVIWDAFMAKFHTTNHPTHAYMEPSYQSGNVLDCTETGSDTYVAEWSAIMFPYLVLTTIGQQEKDRKEQKILEAELNQVQVITELLDYDHQGRTLDEAYYPGLPPETLELRNQDQVVSQSKDTFEPYNERERQGKRIDGTSFILMVPQLWLYKLGGVVVSSYTMPHGTGYALDGYDNEKTFNLRGGALHLKENQPLDAEAHLGLIMTGFIDRFGEHYTSNDVEYRPPLDLFEARVVGLLSEVTEYVKKVPGDESSINGLEYRRERYFIHVISDVRSELAMIKHILEQQERVLMQFLKDCLPANEEQHSPIWVQIKASQETIQQYMRRVEKIDGDADRIEKNIQDMLNLKRTHASIKDAHSSLILSTAVIGFTVITIVFTPLAFLTALFALKIDGFERLQISGSDGVFHSGKISGMFVSTEILTLVLTGIAVWLAFKYINRDQERSLKEKIVAWLHRLKEEAVAWLKGFVTRHVSALTWPVTLILWSKGPKRAKVPDPESPKQNELQRSTPISAETHNPATAPQTPRAQDEATPIRSASVATWPMGRKAQLKHLRSKERTKTPDLESLRQVKLQGATANSSENRSPATAARRASTG